MKKKENNSSPTLGVLEDKMVAINKAIEEEYLCETKINNIMGSLAFVALFGTLIGFAYSSYKDSQDPSVVHQMFTNRVLHQIKSLPPQQSKELQERLAQFLKVDSTNPSHVGFNKNDELSINQILVSSKPEPTIKNDTLRNMANIKQ